MGKNQALAFSLGKDLVTRLAMQSYGAVVTRSFLMGSLFDRATRSQFPFGVYHFSHNLNIQRVFYFHEGDIPYSFEEATECLPEVELVLGKQL